MQTAKHHDTMTPPNDAQARIESLCHQLEQASAAGSLDLRELGDRLLVEAPAVETAALDMRCSYWLGWSHLNRDQASRAQSPLQRAFALAGAENDLAWQSRILCALAQLASSKGRWELALEQYAQALEQSLAIDKQDVTAEVMAHLAMALLSLQMPQEALQMLEEAQATFSAAGHAHRADALVWDLAWAHVALADRARRDGDAAARTRHARLAVETARQALAQPRRPEALATEARGWLALGFGAVVLGDTATAGQALAGVDALTAGSPLPSLLHLRHLLQAQWLRVSGDAQAAIDSVMKALACCDEQALGDRERLALLDELAAAREAQKDFKGALQALRELQAKAIRTTGEESRVRAELLVQQLREGREGLMRDEQRIG